MAPLVPTAHILPPPPPGIVGHLSFLKKNVANAPWWGQHIYKIPTVGPWEEGKYPTHGTRSKFYLMIEAKNILIVFSGFSYGFEGIILFLITTASVFNCGVLIVSIFVLYEL